MKIPLISSIFKKNSKKLKSIDSLVVKRLKELCEKNSYRLFENIKIEHRSQNITLPLLLYIPKKALILFEYKEWSFNELKNATVEKAHHTTYSENSLSFLNANEFIKEKYLDLTYSDDIQMYNFLIMEQLLYSEYEALNDDFKKLVPKDRVFFNDSTIEDMEVKIENLKLETEKEDDFIKYILTQYVIYTQEGIFFANKSQQKFLEKELKYPFSLKGDRLSGKTSLILLKAVEFAKENKDNKIAVVLKDEESVEVFKENLLNYIEFSLTILDMTQITVFSAESFCDAKYSHILVDDENRYEFVPSRYEMSKKASVLYVNKDIDNDFTLDISYAGDFVEFVVSESPVAYAFSLLGRFKETDKTVSVFSNRKSFEDFLDDIKSFYGDVDVSVSHLKKAKINLLNYNKKASFTSDIAIFTDIETLSKEDVLYYIKSCYEKCYIISNEDFEKIRKEIEKDKKIKYGVEE